MRFFKLLGVIFLGVILLSCDEDLSKDFKIQLENNSKDLTLLDTLRGTVKAFKDHEVDSVQLSFQNRVVNIELSNQFSIALIDMMLGNHTLEVNISIDGESVKLFEAIRILNHQKPKLYSYNIINRFPHDIAAYTQGLEFFGDTLYESTGQRGKSTLRKTNYETGEVLREVKLADFYFGEGLSILNDKIYQLTWQAQEGLIYDLNTFELLNKFAYTDSKEGWGLCNDGEKFYKSDGTDKIWILNKDSLEEEYFIQPTTNKTVLNQLNELEWIEGKIFANTYQKDGVVIIDPQTGAVDGVVDFRGLRGQVKQHSRLDVLNGIAYHKESGRLFVTGKNWDQLFEVELVEK